MSASSCPTVRHKVTAGLLKGLQPRAIHPFFILCDTGALAKDTIASELADQKGAGYVFTYNSLKEKRFVSITGTAAALKVCYGLASQLSENLTKTFPEIQWDILSEEGAQYHLPQHKQKLVLFGPAGRLAAESFAGYHIEILGPLSVYDMKDFTHGVWRGLRESGSYTIYFINDRDHHLVLQNETGG